MPEAEFDRCGAQRAGVRIIAPAVPGDAEAISALAAEIWYAHYPGIITTAQIEYMLAQRYDPAVIRDELARGGLWWDVLRIDGTMAGFASYFLTGTAGEMKLDKLYVRQERQRQGCGGMMLARVLDVARSHACRSLVLAVNKNNRNAIAAYLKHGFIVADSVVKDIGGGFVMADYVMVRQV